MPIIDTSNLDSGTDKIKLARSAIKAMADWINGLETTPLSKQQGGTGNTEGGATKLSTPRTINGIAFDGTANIQMSEWIHSSFRDFVNGTLISTNIEFSGSSANDPFILEIKGNSYNAISPFDLQYQGYLYLGAIVNSGGISSGTPITGMVALRVADKLAFWFPRMSYWQGFNVRVYRVLDSDNKNQVTSITDVAKPSATYELAFNNWGGTSFGAAGLGVGQTWQSVARERYTTYYNDTGKSIYVQIDKGLEPNAYLILEVYKPGLTAPVRDIAFNASGSVLAFTAGLIVPPGYSYQASWPTAGGYLSWMELR